MGDKVPTGRLGLLRACVKTASPRGVESAETVGGVTAPAQKAPVSGLLSSRPAPHWLAHRQNSRPDGSDRTQACHKDDPGF